MSKRQGQHAVVIGAGVGGLLFARALSPAFERVTVFERDTLANDSQPRIGIPQGRHLHLLLAAGCQSMEELLPGITGDLRAAGAVDQIAGLSTRVERPGYDPFPQRDCGFSNFSLSRPLLELCVRRRVTALTNVTIEQGVTVEHLLHERGAVIGVQRRDHGPLKADLVVDASGRGDLTLKALAMLGREPPSETTLGLNIKYCTALFEIPDDAPDDWTAVHTPPKVPESSKGLLMRPIENNRWICTITWRGDEQPPADHEEFIEWTRNLRTRTAYNVIKNAGAVGKVWRFIFPESRHRHFAEVEPFPPGLLPVADSICRFNPIYAQGMSVAALEAKALADLLAAGNLNGAQDGLARLFFQRADDIIEGPWTMSALRDLADPKTYGRRPEGFAEKLQFEQAFNKLAARDAAVQTLMEEIRALLKPLSAVDDDPELVERVHNVMAETEKVEA
jgi:2-polyprenyl-6-methoxyphenol hydroxylase-like FAD-dependent oxidoreductase